jgi:hypothetical protein
MSKRGWFYLLLVVGYFPVVLSLEQLIGGSLQLAKLLGGLWWIWLLYAWVLAKRRYPDPRKAP